MKNSPWERYAFVVLVAYCCVWVFYWRSDQGLFSCCMLLHQCHVRLSQQGSWKIIQSLRAKHTRWRHFLTLFVSFSNAFRQQEQSKLSICAGNQKSNNAKDHQSAIGLKQKQSDGKEAHGAYRWQEQRRCAALGAPSSPGDWYWYLFRYATKNTRLTWDLRHLKL